MGIKTNQSIKAIKDLCFMGCTTRWAKNHSNRISRRDAKNEIRKEIQYKVEN
jgi:hypothetical protein